MAEKAAGFGRRVAVVEASRLGGTCVNNGCVPKKVMWYAASLADGVDDAAAFGIPVQRGMTEWGRLVAARESHISNINAYRDRYAGESGIERIAGCARFDTVVTYSTQFTPMRHALAAQGASTAM